MVEQAFHRRNISSKETNGRGNNYDAGDRGDGQAAERAGRNTRSTLFCALNALRLCALNALRPM